MTQEKPACTKLSLNVRKMKFMQRCLDENAKKELEESEKKIITSEHWRLDIPTLGKSKTCFEMFQSFLFCQPCLYGRMSFGGYNRAIEKLMTEMNFKNETDNDNYKSDVSISDDEMADRYASLVGTVGKKFNKKNKGRKLDQEISFSQVDVPRKIKRTNNFSKSRGFIKPSD